MCLGKLSALCLCIIAIISCAPSKRKISSQWIPLFNGISTSYWRSVSSDSFPSAGWRIINDVLVLDSGRAGGDIITREKFGEFEFELDFNLSAGANTGVKYFTDFIQKPNSTKKTAFGFEYQIIDDHNTTSKASQNPLLLTGSLYELYPPQNNKVLYPAGRWNNMKISSKNNVVEHWLNNKMILRYRRDSEDLKNKIKQSKFADITGFGLSSQGYILIQDYGNSVQFRNIRIKRL